MPDNPAARLPAPRQNRNGNDARERLLQAGLRLFAQQGYASTSTRELAQAAQVNVAAISYYFGDKAGLYRAAFIEPLGSGPGGGLAARPAPVNPGSAANRDPSLPEVLEQIFDHLLLPLNNGEQARWCIQLHFREMVEPTGLWAEEIEEEIRPMHELLLKTLRRHMAQAPEDGHSPADRDAGRSEPPQTAEPELRRLALAITGLAVNLYVSHDVITRLEPDLLPGEDTAAGWRDALRRYALAMVEAESNRRARLSPPAIR